MKAMSTIMKAIGWYLVLIAIIIPEPLLAQIAPYTLSPRWMIGRTSGMNFVSGTPVNMTGNPAANGGQEATSSLCFPDKTMFVYCNNTQIYSGANGLIQSINAPSGGQSSTQGAVTLPDPADANRAYVFSGNDQTGGTATGVNWYHIEKSGATYSVIAGPTNIATSAEVNEGLVVSADGNNGYWVISHNKGGWPDPNEYYAWHVTAGGVGGRVVSPSSSRGGGTSAGGSIRISKCQSKIAIIGSQEVEVYNWNKTSGTTGALIGFSGTSSGPGSGYGGEFSPNGNILYFAGLGGSLLQWDLTKTYAAGVVTITGTSGINGMSLGPDDKIYIAKTSTTISSISTPNVIGDGCGYVASALTVTGIGPHIGLANTSWLNPTLPKIIYTIDCRDVDFSKEFKTYFLDDITVTTSSIDWDFGEGAGWQTGLGATPTHTYASNGTFTVKVRFNDATCTQQWNATTSVVISCVVAPVSLVSFTGTYTDDQTNLAWTTVSEINNDYFEIERSDDGITFYTVGKMKGKGTTTEVSNYSFVDEKECVGVTYYRLVQYDYDGTREYSGVITVKNETSSLIVSPNPFTDNFTIVFSGYEASQIKIFDILGRVVLTKAMDQNSYTLSMGEELSKGTYIVNVLTAQESYTYKLVKE